MTPASANRAEQDQRFVAFKQDYNHERPHEALGQKPPASFYQASPRTMPDRLPVPNYAAHVAVRKVRSNGEIRWRGDLIFVSSALVGEAVGIEETEQGQWLMRFFTRPLCIIDQNARKLRQAKPENNLRNTPSSEKLSPIHQG